jgi:hypothetical protein
MVVFLLVALFCVGLIITLIGLHLSPHPRTRRIRDAAYASMPGRGSSQGDRTRNVRRMPAVDQPYRQLKRPYAQQGHVEVEWGQGRGQSASLRVATHRLHSSSGRKDVDGIVGTWSARIPHWLKLTLISGAVFSLCLFLFVQMANFSLSPAMAIMNNFAPQPTSVPINPMVYGENLGLANASKSMVRIAQLDPSQYGSPDEYDQWAGSACSAASMTEIINAYGHNYRITDILKVEAGLHEITPELGLLEKKGIDRTMDQFGFKMVPLEHPTLEGAIAVANQGHPVIVSFANSGYWRGGHILVLRGGDAQNVELADSSRLNLTVVARSQFLQWWNGFTALAVPR